MTARPLALLPIVSLLGLLSCSDPPEQPAAAGFNLTLTNPTLATTPPRVCTAGSSGTRTYIIGKPDSNGTVESGKDGVTVECTVNRSGQVSVTVSGTDDNPAPPQKYVSMTLNGQIRSNTDPSMNPATMTFYSPDTDQLRTLPSYPGCTIGPVSALQDGALLTDFSCDLIGGAEDTTSGCRVTGKIALEYCKTGKEED
jgi:hypothetical protein